MEMGDQKAGGVHPWGPSGTGLGINEARFSICKGRGVDEQDHHMKCLPALGVFDSDLLNPFRQIP